MIIVIHEQKLFNESKHNRQAIIFVCFIEHCTVYLCNWLFEGVK